jgi:ParB/RepB/Spo0J family partition protein
MTATLVQSDRKVLIIPLDDIYSDDDFNCRGKIIPIDVIDLARSIDEGGLDQPIMIQEYNKIAGKKYRIISGHRRYLAHIVLKKETIECFLVQLENEFQARKKNLDENLKRKNLNLLQEAKALLPFIMAKWTEADMSNYLGQSRGWIQARAALLTLPNDIQQEAAAGFLTQEQVKQLATLAKKPDLLYAAVRKIKAAKLNGQKGPIRAVPKKTNALKKRLRTREEIFERMEQFMDIVGPEFYSRCMAWAAGEISDFELYRDFKRVCQEKGITWDIPAQAIKDLVS